MIRPCFFYEKVYGTWACMSTKIGSVYVVYEGLMIKGYVILYCNKAALKEIVLALLGKW